MIKIADQQILYPSDIEDCGLVVVGYLGPDVEDCRTCSDLEILLHYLTETSISPLRKEMIEIDDPFASNIKFTVKRFSPSLLRLEFFNAPTKKIDGVLSKLEATLNKISEIDMQRMQTIIHRDYIQNLSALEDISYEALNDFIIADTVYDTNEAFVSIKF